MTRKNRLHLPTDLKERLTQALGGKRVTAARLITLIESRTTEAPMDKSDLEAGREPLTLGVLAEAAEASMLAHNIRPDDAARLAREGLADAQTGRTERNAQSGDRVASRIADHQARGLDRNAPPEDPIAAALAEEGVGPGAPVALNPYQAGLLPAAEVLRAAEMDDETIERLKNAGLAQVRGLADTMERQVLQRMPAIRAGGGKLRSLEEAAEVLIGELQPNHVDAIRQVCAEHTLEPWVVILGALARMADLQELHAGEFDSEWLNRAPGGGRPASVKEQRCETCGGVLPADARRGQKACCNDHGSGKVSHSEGCSLSHLEMRQGRWVDTRGLVSR